MKIVPCDYLPKEYKGIPIHLVTMSVIECRVFIDDRGKYRQNGFIGVSYRNATQFPGFSEQIIVPIFSMTEVTDKKNLENEIALEECAKESIDASLSSTTPPLLDSVCYVFRHRLYPHICAICVVPSKDLITEFFFTKSVPATSDKKIYPYRYRLERA